MNPAFDDIGKAFAGHYYGIFDLNRAEVVEQSAAIDDPEETIQFLMQSWADMFPLYQEDSLLTFEGTQTQGAQAIIRKYASLTFRNVQRLITTIDCQPLMDGGILVFVLGQLQTDEDHPHSFSQVFILKPAADSFYIAHDMFRLGLHNDAS